MKQFFSILLLLSVIAFAGVSAPTYDNSAQCNIVISFDQIDQSGIFHEHQIGTVEYPIQFWILQKNYVEVIYPVQNPNEGLKFYSWQKDKRESIRQYCRSNC